MNTIKAYTSDGIGNETASAEGRRSESEPTEGTLPKATALREKAERSGFLNNQQVQGPKAGRERE
jgi:hypothetical protein